MKTGGAGCAQLGVAGQVLAGEQQLDRAGAAGVVARQGPRLPHAAAQPVVAVVRGKSSAIVLHLPKVARQKWSEPAAGCKAHGTESGSLDRSVASREGPRPPL